MKKIINKANYLIHKPVAKALVTGLIVITGLLLGHWLSWMFWAAGLWG